MCSGAIRAVIFDDQDVSIFRRSQSALNDAFEARELVESGNDNKRALAGKWSHLVNRSQEIGKVQSAVFVRGAVTTS